jgi:hypothetical protein
MIMKYAHSPLNEPVESISGHYVIDKEAIVPFGGRELLVVFGIAVIDNACCGPGGCRFANVAGYVTAWKEKIDEDGSPVSEVEPVKAEEARKEIKRCIGEIESYCQVNFL